MPARPQTAQVQPLKAPPYLASETAKRANAPATPDPWEGTLKLLMIVFGAFLIAAFAAPWSLDPKMTFSWSNLKGANLYGKIVPMMFAGTGALAIVLSLLPLTNMARGIAATALGAIPFTYLSLGHGGDVKWQSLAQLVGLLTVVGGLLVRSQYKSSMAARIVVTIGVVASIVPYLVPVGDGEIPLVNMFKLIGNEPEAKLKVVFTLMLLPFFLGVASLLAWLPASAPATPAKVLAWLWILLPILGMLNFAWDPAQGGAPISGLLPHVLLEPEFVAAFKAKTVALLWQPMATMAWIGITGYGVATVVGKQLEA